VQSTQLLAWGDFGLPVKERGMFCAKCGNQLCGSNTFCTRCGTRVCDERHDSWLKKFLAFVGGIALPVFQSYRVQDRALSGKDLNGSTPDSSEGVCFGFQLLNYPLTHSPNSPIRATLPAAERKQKILVPHNS
jgi:hypothetical protein